MADIYVRSTDGSDSDNGSTWALAKATLAGAAAIDAAGDTIYVSSAHAESSATAQTVALAGTAASPTRIVSVNDSAEPPTAFASGASIATTGASAISVTGSGYFAGLSFSSGSGASAATIALRCDNGSQTHVGNSFTLGNSSTSSSFQIGQANGSNPSNFEFLDCNWTFGANTQKFEILTAKVCIQGGSVNRSGYTGQQLFDTFGNTGEGSLLYVDGTDLSNLGATTSLTRGGTTTSCVGLVVFRNCKLPASWTGSLVGGALQPGQRVEMWNCDNADTNYRLWIQEAAGSVKHSTAVYKDGWAGSDTAHSWVFATGSTSNELVNRLTGPDMFADNATVGSSVTATVEVVTDGVTLTDADCWLEVMFMGTSGVPLGSWVSDQRANIMTTPADQDSSSESWTTAGLSSPVEQKLSVTFTPQEAGYVIGRVVLAKASTTVYMDPELKLT